MTPDHTATAALGIVESLLAENIDLHDAWIPIRRQDLSTVAFALKRAGALEANLANMLIMLNGAAPVIQPPATARTLPDATEPDPELDDTSDGPPLTDHDWLQLAEAELGRNYAGYLAALGAGNLTWRKLEDDTQTNIILWMLWVLHRKHGRVTGPIWDRHRPHGIIKAAAMYNRMPFVEWVELALSKYAGPEAAGDDFRDE